MNTPVWVGLIAALLAIYMLRYALKSLQQAKDSMRWPSVEGKIVECEIMSGAGTPQKKYLDVKYEYKVNGNTYSGERESFYTLLNTEVEKLHEKYTSSPVAKIYCNSKNPAESTLIVGPRRDKKYSDILIASIALIMSVSIVIAGYLGYIG